MQIDFLYDFGSPNAYLAHKVLPGIAARHGATVAYKPILLGGVFKATNNQPPMVAFADVKGKTAYMRVEIVRFLERYRVPFKMNPHFPVMTIAAMRGAAMAEQTDWHMDYVNAVFDAMWLNGEKMDDPEVMARVLSEAGLPAADIAEGIQTPEVKAALVASTEAAVSRGVFGSPTMFLGDEMFYGKDSLDDLDWRLSRSG